MISEKNNICYIDITGPHYRFSIFDLLSKECNVDFYLGDYNTGVKILNYSDLITFKKKLHVISLPFGFLYMRHALFYALNYDKIILFGNILGVHTWLILIMARLRKKEVYLWSHGLYGKEKLLRKAIKLLFFRMAHKILVYGNYSRELLLNSGFKSEKVVTVYNSIGTVKYIESEKVGCYTEMFNNCDPTIVFMGRLQKSKQLGLLVKCVSKLNKTGFPVNLVFVGDEGDDKSLMEHVKSEMIEDRVIFYGPSYNENENFKLISNAAICVSPGNVGLTSIHVMSYGCPVITHDDFKLQNPEFETVLNGITGYFFERGSLFDLTEKCKMLLNMVINDKENVSRACRKNISKQWSPDSQLKIFKELLNE